MCLAVLETYFPSRTNRYSREWLGLGLSYKVKLLHDWSFTILQLTKKCFELLRVVHHVQILQKCEL
jgi:hypothetical protein